MSRSTEVDETISNFVLLCAGGSNHTMQITPQPTSRKLDHRIAKVDDCAAWHGFDVDPVRSIRQKNLKTTDLVEENG